MPIWVFHSDDDNIVSIQPNVEMVNELRKYNNKVEFTVYHGVKHASWRPTYVDNPVIYEWFAKQDRKNNRPETIQMDTDACSKYSGSYLMGSDTLTIDYGKGHFTLILPTGQQINLLTESESIFSIRENPQFGIKFQIDKGVIKGFYTIVDNKQFARKLTPTNR